MEVYPCPFLRLLTSLKSEGEERFLFPAINPAPTLIDSVTGKALVNLLAILGYTDDVDFTPWQSKQNIPRGPRKKIRMSKEKVLMS